jgi:hypothetical protein
VPLFVASRFTSFLSRQSIRLTHHHTEASVMTPAERRFVIKEIVDCF